MIIGHYNFVCKLRSPARIYHVASRSHLNHRATRLAFIRLVIARLIKKKIIFVGFLSSDLWRIFKIFGWEVEEVISNNFCTDILWCGACGQNNSGEFFTHHPLKSSYLLQRRLRLSGSKLGKILVPQSVRTEIVEVDLLYVATKFQDGPPDIAAQETAVVNVNQRPYECRSSPSP